MPPAAAAQWFDVKTLWFCSKTEILKKCFESFWRRICWDMLRQDDVLLMFSNFHLIARSCKSISFPSNWNFDNRIGIFLKIHMLKPVGTKWPLVTSQFISRLYFVPPAQNFFYEQNQGTLGQSAPVVSFEGKTILSIATGILVISRHTTYSWNIKWQKCAGMGVNGFIFKKINEN